MNDNVLHYGTVAELLGDKCIDMPPIRQVNTTLSRAPRSQRQDDAAQGDPEQQRATADECVWIFET